MFGLRFVSVGYVPIEMDKSVVCVYFARVAEGRFGGVW